MEILISVSLLLNIAVLVPVCAGLLRNAAWTMRAYGQPTPARGILLSAYLAIGIVSCVLLWRHRTDAVAALLAIQIVYKATTPFTVGSLRNPVVMSNLAIAAVHAATFGSIWRHTA